LRCSIGFGVLIMASQYRLFGPLRQEIAISQVPLLPPIRKSYHIVSKQVSGSFNRGTVDLKPMSPVGSLLAVRPKRSNENCQPFDALFCCFCCFANCGITGQTWLRVRLYGYGISMITRDISSSGGPWRYAVTRWRIWSFISCSGSLDVSRTISLRPSTPSISRCWLKLSVKPSV